MDSVPGGDFERVSIAINGDLYWGQLYSECDINQKNYKILERPDQIK